MGLSDDWEAADDDDRDDDDDDDNNDDFSPQKKLHLMTVKKFIDFSTLR